MYAKLSAPVGYTFGLVELRTPAEKHLFLELLFRKLSGGTPTGNAKLLLLHPMEKETLLISDEDITDVNIALTIGQKKALLNTNRKVVGLAESNTIYVIDGLNGRIEQDVRDAIELVANGSRPAEYDWEILWTLSMFNGRGDIQFIEHLQEYAIAITLEHGGSVDGPWTMVSALLPESSELFQIVWYH